MTEWLNSKPPCSNTSCLVFNWRKKQKKQPNISIVVLITSFLAADIVKHKIGQRKWSDKHLLLSITPSEFLTLQTLFSHHGRVWKNKLCLIFFIIWVQIWDPKEFSRFYNCTWHLASISLIESLQPYLINSFHLISLSLEILASKQNFSISSPHV